MVTVLDYRCQVMRLKKELIENVPRMIYTPQCLCFVGYFINIFSRGWCRFTASGKLSGLENSWNFGFMSWVMEKDRKLCAETEQYFGSWYVNWFVRSPSENILHRYLYNFSYCTEKTGKDMAFGNQGLYEPVERYLSPVEIKLGVLRGEGGREVWGEDDGVEMSVKLSWQCFYLILIDENKFFIGNNRM